MADNDNEKLISDFEQLTETLLRTLPYTLRAYYEKLRDEGFSENKAFQLTLQLQNILLTSR